MDLVTQEGEEAATAIRSRKIEQQKHALDSEEPYICPHPELPGNKAGSFVLSRSLNP